MTYARARLWLGISGVGAMVVLSLSALLLNLPSRLLGGRPVAVALTMSLGAYIVISFPFDLFGGYLLPKWQQLSSQTLVSFLNKWLRAVLWQAGIMAFCGYAVVQVARVKGPSFSLVCVAVLMIGLLWGQAPIARLIGGLAEVDVDFRSTFRVLDRLGLKAPAIKAYRSTDQSFVGGLVGCPGRERLIFPAFWLAQFPAEVCALQIARRAGTVRTGARVRGVIVALLWNLVGFALVAHLSGSDLREPAGFITTALWFTFWSFGGLLILPSLSRPAVFEVDRFVKKQGVPDRLLAETMLELDRLQDDEPVRPPWVERIFHPVPSTSSRLFELSSDNSPHGAWQCARTALYLSWACFGFLSRAVHCNSGRPELWVLFPGD